MRTLFSNRLNHFLFQSICEHCSAIQERGEQSIIIVASSRKRALKKIVSEKLVLQPAIVTPEEFVANMINESSVSDYILNSHKIFLLSNGIERECFGSIGSVGYVLSHLTRDFGLNEIKNLILNLEENSNFSDLNNRTLAVIERLLELGLTTYADQLSSMTVDFRTNYLNLITSDLPIWINKYINEKIDKIDIYQYIRYNEEDATTYNMKQYVLDHASDAQIKIADKRGSNDELISIREMVFSGKNRVLGATGQFSIGLATSKSSEIVLIADFVEEELRKVTGNIAVLLCDTSRAQALYQEFNARDIAYGTEISQSLLNTGIGLTISEVIETVVEESQEGLMNSAQVTKELLKTILERLSAVYIEASPKSITEERVNRAAINNTYKFISEFLAMQDEALELIRIDEFLEYMLREVSVVLGTANERVCITTPNKMAGRNFETTIMCSMTSTSYPTFGVESPIEAYETHLGLEEKVPLHLEKRAEFAQVIEATRERLIFTRTTHDMKGDEVQPSPFFNEVVDIYRKEFDKIGEIPQQLIDTGLVFYKDNSRLALTAPVLTIKTRHTRQAFEETGQTGEKQ